MCASCLRIWNEGDFAWSRKLVEVAFELADDEERHMELGSLDTVARQVAGSPEHQRIACSVADLMLLKHRDAPMVVAHLNNDHSVALSFIADILGNPFRPVTINPALLTWHDGLLVWMAKRMYDSHDFTDIPILADALEEAGCTNADILAHCRQPGEHVRGCWAVDLLLGKE